MGAERRRLLLAVLGFIAGTLGSCATEQPPPPQVSVGRPPPPPPSESMGRPPLVPRPTRKPTPPPAEVPAAPGEASIEMPEPKSPVTPEAQSAPVVPDQAGPPAPEAGELIGLDQPAATRLFGPAAERSEQPPATVWRYKNASCELDLFFYLDLRSGQMRTLHYALKGGGADTKRRQDCLRSLVASRGT
jgi:hypothetical protein